MEEEPAPVAAASEANSNELARGRFRRLLPFVSLAVGLVSALTMDRGPRRAALVAVAAAGSWLSLLVAHWLARSKPEAPERASFLLRTLGRSSLAATQSAVQLSLFFAWPFYLHAASGELEHAVFLGVLGALSLCSLWDPLTEWLFSRPMLAPLLPASASFVALNAVLPGFGWSTQRSLRVAALVAVLGVGVLALGSAPPGRRARAFVRSFGLALALPILLELGAARIVPAAPLRLVTIELGTAVHDREIVDPSTRLTTTPARLYCATAISSPVGVHDRLFHVWRYGDALRSRIELEIHGGRGGGFRTFSRIDGFGAHAAGRYSCSVETANGQVLGSKSLVIEPAPRAP